MLVVGVAFYVVMINLFNNLNAFLNNRILSLYIYISYVSIMCSIVYDDFIAWQ